MSQPIVMKSAVRQFVWCPRTLRNYTPTGQFIYPQCIAPAPVLPMNCFRVKLNL